MFWFPFFRRRKPAAPTPQPATAPVIVSPAPIDTHPVSPRPAPRTIPAIDRRVRRHFYNERGFQTYASFFEHWDGFITAGHCLTEAQDLTPPFARGDVICQPDGLDAALIGCNLPSAAPPAPYAGQDVVMMGYPAGARTAEIRKGKVYIARPGAPGNWIAHIIDPDEPVVTGMSGGMVMDAGSGEPIGIIITRNSPADLNNDRDPDESCDFTALSAVWEAVMATRLIS